jgi:acyl-CoA thioesterase FadM
MTKVGTTSVAFECAAFRVSDDAPMCTATQTLVYIDRDRRKLAIPDEYRERVTAFEAGTFESRTAAAAP